MIWGREWDELLARDIDGVLVNKMNETVDGEFQKYSVAGGAYIREHFFGPDPRLGRLVEHLSDDDLTRLRRGGHDYRKVYAAYKRGHRVPRRARRSSWPRRSRAGRSARASRRATSPTRPRSSPRPSCASSATGWSCPIPDEQLQDAPYYHPGPDSEEIQYLLERRRALGGVAAAARRPRRRRCRRPRPRSTPSSRPAPRPPSARRWSSPSSSATCMRDPGFGTRIVPIVPDEARTFGMDPLFKEVGIYAAGGQQYEPVDSDLVLSLPRGEGRPGAGGGDHRGRLDGVAPGRRHVVRHPRRADDPVLHLLLDVRLPADRRPGLGARPTRAAAASCSAPPPAGRR